MSIFYAYISRFFININPVPVPINKAGIYIDIESRNIDIKY